MCLNHQTFTNTYYSLSNQMLMFPAGNGPPPKKTHAPCTFTVCFIKFLQPMCGVLNLYIHTNDTGFIAKENALDISLL